MKEEKVYKRGGKKDEVIKVSLLFFLLSFICLSANAESINCNSCEDCTAKLNGSYEVVYLNESIYNHSGTCITFNANNTIFDCQGNTIEGTSSVPDPCPDPWYFNETGIYLVNEENSTIRNCIITGYKFGIQLNDHSDMYVDGLSKDNLIINNIATSNDVGIYLGESDNNEVVNNTVVSNEYSGLWLWYSWNNLLDGNTINSNYKGIYFEDGSRYNVIATNTINSNWRIGIDFEEGFNNNIRNNNLKDNGWYGIYLESSYNNAFTNNTVANNGAHGIYIRGGEDPYYHSKNNTINSNTFCNNNESGGDYYDIYNQDSNSEDSNSGDNNTCDTTYNWNDTGTTGCTYSCSIGLGDINDDDLVDLIDLALMGQAWQSSEGDTNWNANADLNSDGKIDLSDLIVLGQNWNG